MFNLFRRKPEATPKPIAAAPKPREVRPAAPSTAFDQMEVIARCIERFMDRATFVGSLDAAPGYNAQVMPNGIQVAASQAKRIGVVLDTGTLGISVAGVRGMDLAVVAASSYFRNYQKQDPKWQAKDMPGGTVQLLAEVPFGMHNLIELTCSDGPVDTQFEGKTEPGCTLMITVRTKA